MRFTPIQRNMQMQQQLSTKRFSLTPPERGSGGLLFLTWWSSVLVTIVEETPYWSSEDVS